MVSQKYGLVSQANISRTQPPISLEVRSSVPLISLFQIHPKDPQHFCAHFIYYIIYPQAIQIVSEHFIGGISSRGDENDVTTSLVESSPMCWLDSMGPEQGAIWQAIVFLHLADLWRFVWLEVQRDELHYDWEGPL